MLFVVARYPVLATCFVAHDDLPNNVRTNPRPANVTDWWPVVVKRVLSPVPQHAPDIHHVVEYHLSHQGVLAFQWHEPKPMVPPLAPVQTPIELHFEPERQLLSKERKGISTTDHAPQERDTNDVGLCFDDLPVKQKVGDGFVV